MDPYPPCLECQGKFSHRFWCGKTSEQVEQQLAASFDPAKQIKKREAWILLVDDKRVRLSSGKQLWNQIGHAKSALSNHLETKLGYYWRENPTIQKFIAERVKFVRLEEIE